MKNIKYKTYSKERMLEIIDSEGFTFVETDLGDNYIVRIADLADFIMLEAQRTEHKANMSVYIPGIEEPVITTYGCFLNKANQVLREEIIERLVKLQKNIIKPKKVKIFDNDMFVKMSPEDMGIRNNCVRNFDLLYSRYVIK